MKMIYGKLREVVMSKAKGQFANITWEKELKTLKTVNAKVEKHSDAVVRFGVEYDNISKVQEKRELGILPSENSGLPWGQYKEYPYFISHKGQDYLRVSLVPNNRIKSTYYIDGVEATREQAEKLCLASEFKKSDNGLDVLTIKVENILNVK
jgi:hypothetical protein